MLLHTHHDHDRPPEDGGGRLARDQRMLAMGASLAVAVLMLVGKLYAYFLTGSTAILSDALESVVHLFATAIAGVSLWYASQPPDRQHPYGHGKVAYFSSGFEGALILLAAAGIIYAAVQALIHGPELERLGAGLLITGALALVNLALGLTLIHVGRKHNAIVLIANGQHVLTDMWTSLGVLAGVALVWATGIVWLDPIVAILVGSNIVWTAVQLMRRSYEGLMERADPDETRRIVERLDRAQEAGIITGYHHLRHRRVNDRVWIEAHLLFPAQLLLTEAHRRATDVEDDLRDLFPRDHVSISTHLEPSTHEHRDPGAHDVISDPFAQ